MTLTDLDRDVRAHLYRRFVDDGRPPTAEETAEAFGIPTAEAEESYRRLAESRMIVLHPGTVDLWMVNPLSAVPTGFVVETAEGKRFDGVCAWDAPGVLAMLETDGRVLTSCPDCDEPLTMEVREGDLQPLEAVAHFSVPAARWWEDIGFA